MPLTINNMTLGQVNRATKYESTFLKIAKALSALFTAIVPAVLLGYFIHRRNNVNEIQDNCTALVNATLLNTTATDLYCGNSTLYDWNIDWDGDAGFYRHGNWTDVVQADEYIRLLGNCDAECRSIGTKWSMVYILCYAVMIIIMLQGLLLTLGVWWFPARLTGMIMQTFCAFTLFGAMVTTAVFRFNTYGKLAALSLSPIHVTHDEDGNVMLDTERTYNDDGTLLLRLWVVTLLFVVAQCCLGCFAAAPPTQDRLRKWNVDIETPENEQLAPHLTVSNA